MTRILIIEDDVKINKLLSSDMELEGFNISSALDGAEGYDKAKREKPDLIILDIMLPKMNGYEVCRALRRDKFDSPIIMLTAKGQETEKVVGFEIGADDYMTKPFSAMELMARVKALLRRHKRELKKVDEYSFDDIKVNFRKMEATKAGKKLSLTTKEFQILELLIRYRGDVVSRRQFLDDVWGYDALPTTRTVDNQIQSLRQKLSEKSANFDQYIVTIHGSGYKFLME